MKIGAKYSHLNGFEWINTHQNEIWDEIEEIIKGIDADDLRTKVSREKNMRGRMLFSPKALKRKMQEEFDSRNWQKAKSKYWVTDDYELITKTMKYDASEQKKLYLQEGKQAYSSSNQISFLKNRIAVEVQFGKYSFIAYDIFVKHNTFYLSNSIDVAVEILPMKKLQEEMSSGPGYYEGALYDIARQGGNIPTVPLVLVGIEP